jgi:hypothetical protein
VLEPDIPGDGLPIAEQVVPKPDVPEDIVPVGGGLSPGEASPVAPMGIPVGATGEPGAMPSGEVPPIPGVGLPIPPTCANTGFPRSAASIAAINTRRIVISIVLAQQSGRVVQCGASQSTAQHRRFRRMPLA